MVSYSSLKQIFFKKDYLLNLRIIFDVINATICFVHLALLFLESSIVVRRNDDIYLNIARPIKHYAYQKIGKKNINQFLANTGLLK